MITTLAFGGYRSLRELRLLVGRLNVISGGNGAGKSELSDGPIIRASARRRVLVTAGAPQPTGSPAAL